jgi:hypothetical protein
MNTQNPTNSSNSGSTPQQQESKEALNKKTSVQFGLSLSLGVITIILVAVTAYYGLVGY